MPNDSYTQQALAADTSFKQRVRSSLSSVAWQVLNEDPATANHTNRENFARQVVRNLDNEVAVIMPSFVMRPNVINFATTYEFDWISRTGHVASACGDADIQSQLFTDWDQMAEGAGFFTPPPLVVPANSRPGPL